MQNAPKKVWQAPQVTVVDFSQTLGGGGNASENAMGNPVAMMKKNGS